ncbi:spore coat protein CotH [Seminavis robusta]|uniref:Spore coat protein CotH n=1 Tax=Seminavis robusta TaxID=568900 RepID=A0A9N8HCZ6_9STRA|nr:spore coat protein CotH [Seminavis robusta]|eukprot:Sro239_g095920.1 spore coat protein CotH (846) ;mRNA; f:45520-48057
MTTTTTALNTNMNRLLALVSIWLSAATTTVQGELVISEVAPRGSSNACDGDDWVELWNNGDEAILMTGWMIADDRGWTTPDSERFEFPDGFEIGADEYLLMCTGGDTMNLVTPMNANFTSFVGPTFGIGAEDSLNLVRPDGSFTVLGPFPEPQSGSIKDITFALDPSTGEYNFTSTPTPGEPNIITRVPTEAELIEEQKVQLAAQNDAGIEFFNFNRQGLPVEDGFDAIVELKITMANSDFDLLMSNPQHQTYFDFQSASVVTEDGVELLVLDDPGRIRTRGDEATFMASCLGSPLPFRLDFDDVNKTQTLFGVQQIYLRHPLFDASYMREWAYPRMLARFGMPHARTRMVHFYINEKLIGFYTLMEIPEQEYVFARNFPNYNPKNFALFQIDPLTEGCGQYSQAELQSGRDRVDDSSTPPYSFERGTHVRPIQELGADMFKECQAAFADYKANTLMEDVVLAYVRHDEVCSDTFLDEGLVDQELGSDNWDNEIKNFIRDFMSFQPCDPDCTNSDLAKQVDIQNFLKMFAFYAVTLTIDSPLSEVNNYHLAQEESKEEKWKLVAYDFSKPGSPSCNTKVCEERLIHWSLVRPTCLSLEENVLVGPLLLNVTASTEYLGYVREFLDTVFANATFLEQIQSHASEIQDAVESSFGGSAGSFANELSPDATSWDAGGFPLLPTMKARAEDVEKQLAAIDDGSIARGPHQGKENEPWESCGDWQLSEPDTSACEGGCKYDGCNMPGWTVECFCEEATGVCYRGDEDLSCDGIVDGERYTGMEDGTFCKLAGGVTVKASACLEPGAVAVSNDGGDSPSSSGSSRWSTAAGAWPVAELLFVCVLVLSRSSW